LALVTLRVEAKPEALRQNGASRIRRKAGRRRPGRTDGIHKGGEIDINFLS